MFYMWIFFQVEQLKGGRTCSGDERGFRPNYNNYDKNSKSKNDDKKQHNNHLDNYDDFSKQPQQWQQKYNSLLDNDIDYLSKTATTTMATKYITIFWTMIRTILQKPQQQQWEQKMLQSSRIWWRLSFRNSNDNKNIIIIYMDNDDDYLVGGQHRPFASNWYSQPPSSTVG